METSLRFLIWVCKVFSGVFALFILIALALNYEAAL